jgi:tetratricopeptide (TPR) repeat protein
LWLIFLLLHTSSRPIRFAVAILAIAFCFFIIQASARFGFSRLLGRFATTANYLPAADEAVRITPSDPEAHRARARVFSRQQKPVEASQALESAASLRHRDDYLWLELGNAREEAGDQKGALVALDQAVRWAPYYAHTHWQRGNLLLRMGRTAEAFAELRTAAAANQTYLPSLIDLAWGISGKDVAAAEQLIGITSERERRSFAEFLARRGELRKAFSISYESDPAKVTLPAVFNAGFEEPLVQTKTVFGNWSVSTDQSNSKLAVDVAQKFSGERSVQITLNGQWDPAASLLSQTVIVDPGQTYRVSFAVMTKDLATGGPPVIAITDATTGQLSGKSEGFPSTPSWTTLSFDFKTLATSEAVVIRLQRNNCATSPCPIFGVVWLDDVKIEPQKSTKSTN